jgi:hypothetical protein
MSQLKLFWPYTSITIFHSYYMIWWKLVKQITRNKSQGKLDEYIRYELFCGKFLCNEIHIVLERVWQCSIFFVFCFILKQSTLWFLTNNKFSSNHVIIEATNCGFCYTEEGNSAVNGSCLPYKETASSSIGRCNSTELPSDLVWADNFCPSSYSWMGLLGLVIFSTNAVVVCFVLRYSSNHRNDKEDPFRWNLSIYRYTSRRCAFPFFFLYFRFKFSHK